MINKDNNFIGKFTIVLSIIILFEILNFVMSFYISSTDTVGFNVVDMVFIIKFIGVVTLFISLFWWGRSKHNNLLKEQVIIHTVYVFAISIFYFTILYLFKYSIILSVMDILRNKMIEGNPALLLNFSVYSYNTLKYVEGVYQSFTSELILMIELLFITWNLRNLMTLTKKEEKNVHYDSFLHKGYLKYVTLALLISSFLSINLFEFVFDFLGAMMFLISFFLFSLQLPLHYFTVKLSNMQPSETTKSVFVTLQKSSFILSIITAVGFVVYLCLIIYGFTVGVGSYRLFSALTSLVLVSIVVYNTSRTLRLVEQ